MGMKSDGIVARSLKVRTGLVCSFVSMVLVGVQSVNFNAWSGKECTREVLSFVSGLPVGVKSVCLQMVLWFGQVRSVLGEM